MRRILAASLMGLLMTSASAQAAEEGGAAMPPSSALATEVNVAQRSSRAGVLTDTAGTFKTRRPMLLPALYSASAFLQGYDTYSTLAALKRGGIEANPVMRGVTKSPAAFIGLKAGVTMMSIMAAERMWKNQNKVGAVATMLISNGLMTAVAANNARVLSRVK